MAGSIKYNSSMVLVNGTLNDTYNTSGLTAVQTTQGLVRNIQTLLSASVQGDALDLGSVVTPGMAMFSNLEVSPGNFCEIGVQVTGTFYPFLKLLAGQQSGPLILGAAAIYGRANTGNVKLFYIIYET